MLPHSGRETHFPNALHAVFGKVNHLSHDATTRYVFAPWRYSESIQEADDELDLEVAQKEGRIDGAMGRDFYLCSTKPGPAGSLPLPP